MRQGRCSVADTFPNLSMPDDVHWHHAWVLWPLARATSKNAHRQGVSFNFLPWINREQDLYSSVSSICRLKKDPPRRSNLSLADHRYIGTRAPACLIW